MMRWGGLVIAAGMGCASGLPSAAPQAEQEAAEPAVVLASEPALPPELRGLGVAIDARWAEAAPLWVIAEFEQSTYPCREGPDGSLDMILRDAFIVREVLRGSVALPEIDVDAGALQGPSYPPGLTPGRRYLLMLAPTPEMTTLLADPQARLSMDQRLDRAQIVAVIDLSQSAAERASEAVTASRSGTHEGVRFDPERWAAARAAPVIGAEHAALVRFIGGQLLARPGASVTQMRSWLGAPDVQQRRAGTLLYRYWLARPSYLQPVAGALYGQLELQFVGDALAAGSVRYFRWEIEPNMVTSREVPAEGLRERGLATVVLTR